MPFGREWLPVVFPPRGGVFGREEPQNLPEVARIPELGDNRHVGKGVTPILYRT